MISFESDYNNGTVPQIIERLAEANNQKTSGYGFDAFTEEAKTKIKKAEYLKLRFFICNFIPQALHQAICTIPDHHQKAFHLQLILRRLQ